MKNKIIFTLLLLCYAFVSNAQVGTELLIKANRASLEKNYALAIDYYSQYIKLNPEDFRGYFNRGTTEYNYNKFSDGVRDFTKCLELNPIYKEAYYYRGKCKEGLKNTSGAIEDYTHVLIKDSNNVGFLKARAHCYTSIGKRTLALEDLDKAIAISKLEGETYKQRAELKVELKDVEGALLDYNAVEKLMPKYKMVHYIKGNLYLQLNEKEEACEQYKIALLNNVVVAERVYQQNCL